MCTATLYRHLVELALIPLVIACQLPVESDDVTETNVPPQLALAFGVQPTDGYTGIRLVPDVEVNVVDERGQPVLGVTLPVTVGLENNTTGATLSGTTTVYTIGGLARFTDLSVDRSGAGYILIAQGENLLAAVSDPFSIIPPDALTLIMPIGGTEIRQNDPTISCPAHYDRGYGFQLRFAWTAHPSAVRYRLFAMHRGAVYPILNLTVAGTEYTDRRCNSFVIDRNLDNWEWLVEALDGVGNLIESSAVGQFRFAPCRLANGRPCSAPAGPA